MVIQFRNISLKIQEAMGTVLVVGLVVLFFPKNPNRTKNSTQVLSQRLWLVLEDCFSILLE